MGELVSKVYKAVTNLRPESIKTEEEYNKIVILSEEYKDSKYPFDVAIYGVFLMLIEEYRRTL
jgi:hypothetical protein